MMEDPDNSDVVLGYDFLAPEGHGEIIGGSQREHDINKIIERLKAKGEKIEDYEFYLDTRRYGSVPHGGFGLGVERVIKWICGLENIKDVWIIKGKQPTYRDIDGPTSKYSASTYQERFGSWNRALEAFSDYINSAFEDTNSDKQNRIEDNHSDFNQKARRKTRRDISERMRFSVLLRDGFRCQSCGRSPLKSPGVELQVDHIIPWSKGGETVQSNLQTKCKKCNLGKGNALKNSCLTKRSIVFVNSPLSLNFGRLCQPSSKGKPHVQTI